MKLHHVDRPRGEDRVYTASEEACPDCEGVLPVYQNDQRRVQGLDDWFWWKRRDKRCRRDCPGPRPLYHAPRDLRVALPGRMYSLDVTLYVGESHLLDGRSLSKITRELNERGLPLYDCQTGRMLRDYVALSMAAYGDDKAMASRLVRQGGITLMCDGVQFDDRSPVLYMVWDAVSGMPLFGERKEFRGADDLIPLLRRVKAMGVPVIGVVTDKETGLVPAVEEVFPGVPHQYCQTHFLKNCALALGPDLAALDESVRRRADAVRAVAEKLRREQGTASAVVGEPPAPVGDEQATASAVVREPPAPVSDEQATESSAGGEPAALLSDVQLGQEVCDMVRANRRVSGKAPLDPPELKRHDRLEALRRVVDGARKKNGGASRTQTRKHLTPSRSR